MGKKGVTIVIFSTPREGIRRVFHTHKADFGRVAIKLWEALDLEAGPVIA